MEIPLGTADQYIKLFILWLFLQYCSKPVKRQKEKNELGMYLGVVL